MLFTDSSVALGAVPATLAHHVRAVLVVEVGHAVRLVRVPVEKATGVPVGPPSPKAEFLKGGAKESVSRY